MTRATIADASPSSKQKSLRTTDETVTTTADDGGDGVLLDQFTRELKVILRQIHDAQDVDSGFSANGDEQTEKRSVAHYGVISQRLLTLVRRLVDRTEELEVDQKARLLLQFGDKLVSCHEYQAADRYFYTEIVGLSRTSEDEAKRSGSSRAKDDVYVQAVFGQATCRFRIAKRADPYTRFPGTLATLLNALGLFQHGMEVAVELERTTPHKHAWLILNGSVFTYTIARPLQTLGFEREVISYLKWCLLCLQSTVMLSTTKYILWRLQIYSVVCECLERLAGKRPKRASVHLQSALACAEHAAQAVSRLRKEEELDTPLPKPVDGILRQAEAISEVLVARTRSVLKGEGFGRKGIQSLSKVQNVHDHLHLVIDELENSVQSSGNSEYAGELFEFAIELTQPLIDALTKTGDGNQVQRLDAQLPIVYHLALIRHAYHLQKSDSALQLLGSARARICTRKVDDAVTLELNFWNALVDSEKPVINEVIETPMDELTVQRQRAMVVAGAARNFVVRVREAVPNTLRDLLVATSLRLWKQSAVDMLRQLDESLNPTSNELDQRLLHQTVLVIDALYTVLRTVDFDDMIVLGEICMRLCLLLSIQENRRKAIRTVRNYLVLLNAFRDKLVDPASHFSDTGQSLARASFTFDLSRDYSNSDCYSSDDSQPVLTRREVGVGGTGSQLGGLYQELACIQTDALQLLYRLELEEAAMIDATHSSTLMGLQKPPITAKAPSMIASIKSMLQKEFKKNLHARVLLNIQLLERGDETSERADVLVDECFKCLSQADYQESDLNKSFSERENDTAQIVETVIPCAPTIVKRCSSSITVQVIPFKPTGPAVRRRAIAYYMVFGKPSGAGTDVSLNNTEFPGTGEPVYSPELLVTVSGLSSDKSYVFAVAAFDNQGEVIQGIGETSKPVVALNSLPSVACYGYLAQVCYKLGLLKSARKAAMHVYDLAVSKDFGDRPGWASNYFFRHALKRAVIARWPLPLLDIAVHCILVLCDAEDGDVMRDGQLTSDGLILRGRQTAVLEKSKTISIGVEMASAAADYEQIRVLIFKGYRTLLPLLHLDDTNGLAFAALSTFYQAVLCIPASLWDTDTRSIAARIAFELMRIGWRHYHLSDAAYTQVLRLRTSSIVPQDTPSCIELAALLDTLAQVEGSMGSVIPNSPTSRPVTAGSVQPPPGKQTGSASASSAKTPAVASTTPQTTARATEEAPLPRISELIAQSKLNLREAFRILEPFVRTNRDSLEVFCKLCLCALDANEEGVLEEWIPEMKVSGNIGTKCKEDIKAAGLGHFLPEPVPTPAVPSSAPNTARSTAKTPRVHDATAQNTSIDASKQPPPISEPELGEDDDYVYMWCGEVCLVEVVVEFRKLARRRTNHEEVNCMRGPQYNYAFSILHSESAIACALDVATNERESASGNEGLDRTSRDLDAQDTTFDLIKRLMARAAASCRLFRLARAWQALQTVAQYASNSIWLAWVSPELIGHSNHSSILNDLADCANSLVDMIEIVSATVNDEQAGRAPTLITTTFDTPEVLKSVQNRTRSLASTAVVVSAMSSVSADTSWISNLLEFTLQALLAAKRWHEVVQIGKKYHRLTGGGTRFSEKVVSLLVYAQQQYFFEQVTRLESAQEELMAFVKAFNEAEAKKKKKKSRLVVEDILTPEEIEFRSKKEEKDSLIKELDREKCERQRELEALKQIQDVVSRTTNKCTQALDSCHVLAERYRRFGDSVVKPQQVINAFTHCVALSRQKRQRRLACKALQELGDFLWERGDEKAAVKTWNEAIDNAFNALRATTCWREVVGIQTEEHSGTSDPLIEGDGMWTCLDSCIAMSKLILYDHESGTSKLELARMAAATFTRIITRSSLPHPSRSFLYGFHELLSPIWPGRELLVDAERLEVPRLVLMFSVTTQILLQYEHPVDAMPLIAGYEYLATHCIEDVDHATNARRMRLDALVQCERYHEAFQVVAILLSDAAIGLGDKPRVPTVPTVKLRFRDDKAMKDPSNADVLAWLTSINLQKVHEDLCAMHCRPDTGRLVVFSILKLVVSLVQREPIEEETTSTLRQVSSKMAAILVGIAKKSLEAMQIRPQQDNADTQGKPNSRTATEATWESLMLHHFHAEVLLQQAIIAASGGQWTIAQEVCTESIQTARQLQTAVSNASNPVDILSLDRSMPPSFLVKSSTLVVRARLLNTKMGIAREKLQDAAAQIEVAVKEARSQGEQAHFVLQLELLRAVVLVLLGVGATALQELSALRDAFLSSHSNETFSYVELLRLLAFVMRAQATESRDSSKCLQRVLMLLEEAEAVLDRLLRRDGWIGTDVDVAHDKRMSIFNPNVAVFVHLKADIVQALMETPSEDNDTESRMRIALQMIDSAVNAVNHSIKSLVPTKAKLLLQKGAILKKILVRTMSTERQGDLFHQCATSLVASIEEAIRVDVGGHDRELIRLAFVELVDLFGAKLINGKEAEHLQAAFHYLNLALLVRSQNQTLFDSLELQAGNLVSADKLPQFLIDSVIRSVEGTKTDTLVPEPERATPPGKAVVVQPAADALRRPHVDTARVVNFFVNALRAKNLLPPCAGLQEDVVVLLHAFLVQNHSTYAKLCCLQSVPAVPQDDPEIKGGIICSQWVRDLSPAFTSDTSQLSRATVSLYFTLGTTRIDGHSDLAEVDEGVRVRVERFSTSPLLTKRSGLIETEIREIGEMLSRLRIDMEDADSLVIDRTAFPGRFRSIAVQIQRLFRRSSSSTPGHDLTEASKLVKMSDEAGLDTGEKHLVTDSVMDSFNVEIPVNCSLETVRILESIFHVDQGANNAIDNGVCYFLRDLVDN